MALKNCMTCTGKNPQKASFECLNCENTFLCQLCKVEHLKNPRHKNHKIVEVLNADDMGPFKVED
jgi:hypothetical protein